eukprot:NODE_3797_length_378_cov_497.948328_g3226_i0.p1 GENE.NODE_3797_length_378_cov_497.948328_g3226_i0~~NODE_3797_length_378_cov_497.948328_g3226_i0.p1  ORF type:complete len:89 (+),score=29.02 NODE_3797_length_378_cov_497.948328_g3226_i0:35-268(+)
MGDQLPDDFPGACENAICSVQVAVDEARKVQTAALGGQDRADVGRAFCLQHGELRLAHCWQKVLNPPATFTAVPLDI